MIIKIESVLFPYVRQRVIKKANVLRRSDRIIADRIMLALLFGITIVAAVLFA